MLAAPGPSGSILLGFLGESADLAALLIAAAQSSPAPVAPPPRK